MTLIYSLNSVNKSWQPEFLQKKTNENGNFRSILKNKNLFLVILYINNNSFISETGEI